MNLELKNSRRSPAGRRGARHREMATRSTGSSGRASFRTGRDVRDAARQAVFDQCRSSGIYPASIHELYLARGRGEVPPTFTVPAINIRGMAYDTARALFRARKALDAGAVLIEIARSEITYTDQRPAEYVFVLLAAALREGWRGPVFIQGDHFQINAKKYAADPEAEMQTVLRPDGRGDRGRLLQHRRGHLDAGGSGQAHARRAAAAERHAVRRDHRVHPQARAARACTSRWAARSARSAARTRPPRSSRRSSRIYNAAAREARARRARHEQDLDPDRHQPRRRAAAGRHRSPR